MKQYTFSLTELEGIQKMPPWMQDLAEKYPIEIANAVEVWSENEFPNNYVPTSIEVYYEPSDEPDIFIYEREVINYLVKESLQTSTSIMVDIDGRWAYVEIEGKVIVDKLGGVILPEVIVDPSLLMSTALKGEMS